MEFVLQKIKKPEYMAAKKILYYVLNISYIFTHSRWIYCSCQKLQGCLLQNGDKFFCYICKFRFDYHPEDMHKIINPKKNCDTYVSMKKNLKNYVNFDPSIDEFWLYDFKFNWKD